MPIRVSMPASLSPADDAVGVLPEEGIRRQLAGPAAGGAEEIAVNVSRGPYALADTWDGGHARPTSFFAKLCGITQKSEILHSDFGSKVSGEGLIRCPVG